MAPGPLRRAIEDFIATSPPSLSIKTYWEQCVGRSEELTELFNTVWPLNGLREYIWFTYFLGLGIVYFWTGFSTAYEILNTMAHPPSIESVTDQVQVQIRKAFSSPAVADVIELIGTIITDPVFNLFEQYAGKDNVDPKDFARAFHGLMTGITTTGAISDAVAEVTSAGAIKAVGNMVQSVYWNLGLGFLGWQTMAPILSAGLQPGLTRYYQKLYRPMRFGASELRDLYALGAITPDRMREEARNLGWRDGDIEQWIRLAFRTLSASDVWQAWHEGKRDPDWVVERMRALGYDPADIPLMMQLNPAPPEHEIKDLSASTARASYREGLISAEQLRTYLTELDYSTAEINLIIGLEDLKREDQVKRLTVSQIKEAWTSNVLSDAEARHWLETAGFAGEQITLLMQTWAAEVQPTFRKVNSGTVIGAYVEHIYNRLQAYEKLLTIGFREEDATLELDLAELRNPEAFQPPAPPPPKLLTPGVLAELVFYGLLTPVAMQARLIAMGYTEADAALLSEAARLRTVQAPRPLPFSAVANAYVAGVIDRQTAREMLVALGYSEGGADIALDTLEAQFPQAFGAPPEVRIRQLTEGTLIDLTVARVITIDELRARLTELAYVPADIELVIVRVGQLMAPDVRIMTQSTVERAYITGVITREQTLARLVGMAFTPEDAENIVLNVEAENPAVFNPGLIQPVRLPSIAALVAAVGRGLITEDEYLARCAEVGLSADDARLYLALATRNERKSTTALNPSQIVAAYGKGFYSFSGAQSFLTQRGYSDGDAAILLRIQKDLITNTEAWYSLLHGDLGYQEVLVQLINGRYSDEDIMLAFGSLSPQKQAAFGIDIRELNSFLGEFPGGQ